MSWLEWFDERWPGWLDKRPKWLEAMNRLEETYSAPLMDAATMELQAKWKPDHWGIGDRPPTWAEFRAVLDDKKRPDWVLRNYPHLRQILGIHDPRNDYKTLGEQEKAEMAAKIGRAFAGVEPPRPKRAA